jgi:hypothetical protein
MRGWRTIAGRVCGEGARHLNRARVVARKSIRSLAESNAVLALRVRAAKWRKIIRHTQPPIVINESRRAFLKYAVFGGVVFLIGKYIDPFINMLRGDTVLGERNFQHFKMTETGRRIQVTDDDGDELLTIDKEEF